MAALIPQASRNGLTFIFRSPACVESPGVLWHGYSISSQIKKYLNHDVEFNEEKNITCSIGISYERNVTSESQITELIKKADDLMYTVKTGEKGHYAFF